MPTTQAEFQQVALEIKAEFADFFKPLSFTLAGDYDVSTATTTDDTIEIVDAMREEYNPHQVDGQSIQSNDFKLLALDFDFKTLKPVMNGLKVTVNSKSCTIINAMLDAADAVWTIQVRG